MNTNICEKLNILKQFDTPTICNALELVDENRHNFGYTDEMLICLNPRLPPIVGIAKTATVRSMHPPNKTLDEIKSERIEYYTYVNDGNYPKISAIQDLDGIKRGHGPFFGEFNSRIHKVLGCQGAITDGSFRDITNIPNDFQILAKSIKPAHAHIHIVDYNCQINICSMLVNPGDVIHADANGAVSFPVELINLVIQKSKEFVNSEKSIIDACKKSTISFEELMRLYKEN